MLLRLRLCLPPRGAVASGWGQDWGQAPGTPGTLRQPPLVSCAQCAQSGAGPYDSPYADSKAPDARRRSPSARSRARVCPPSATSSSAPISRPDQPLRNGLPPLRDRGQARVRKQLPDRLARLDTCRPPYLAWRKRRRECEPIALSGMNGTSKRRQRVGFPSSVPRFRSPPRACARPHPLSAALQLARRCAVAPALCCSSGALSPELSRLNLPPGDRRNYSAAAGGPAELQQPLDPACACPHQSVPTSPRVPVPTSPQRCSWRGAVL